MKVLKGFADPVWKDENDVCFNIYTNYAGYIGLVGAHGHLPFSCMIYDFDHQWLNDKVAKKDKAILVPEYVKKIPGAVETLLSYAEAALDSIESLKAAGVPSDTATDFHIGVAPVRFKVIINLEAFKEVSEAELKDLGEYPEIYKTIINGISEKLVLGFKPILGSGVEITSEFDKYFGDLKYGKPLI